MSADRPFIDGPYKWAQDTPGAQMVSLHMFLEGHYSNFKEGIIDEAKFLRKLDDYINEAKALIRHISKNPSQWVTVSAREIELEKMILPSHPTHPGPETAIGYWTEETGNPKNYIYSGHIKEDDFQTIISYLKGHNPYSKFVKTKHRFRGFARCLICKKANGSTCLSDKTYIWPDGFGHYVEQHQIQLPQVFIQHILRNVSSLF